MAVNLSFAIRYLNIFTVVLDFLSQASHTEDVADDQNPSTSEFDTPRDVITHKPARVSSRVSGTTDVIREAIGAHTQETSNEETILDIKVHNPLKRIAKLLEQIKNHQTTTVSLRFTIPLIALPIVILAAFQLGRAQTICSQTFATQQGTLQRVSVRVPKDRPGVLKLLLSFFPSVPAILHSSQLVEQQRTILIAPNRDIIQVLHDRATDVSGYINQEVLLTGNYSACTKTMTLDDRQNITVLTSSGL